MKVDILVLGELETNCYIVSKDNKVLIIDPADDAEQIINFIGNKEVVGCLVTHFHYDHIGALDDILSYYKIKVNDYESIKDFNFEVIKTPGHTSDSCTYYFANEKIMFVGDFIFYRTIGRTDLPTGDMKTMMNSIKHIKTYDDDITLYPGHGLSTNLGFEKKHNPYFS